MYVKDLQVNTNILEQTFQVRSASFRITDGVNGYYLMRVGDKTGLIDAIWLNTKDRAIRTGDFLKINGKVQNYQGRQQLKISLAILVDPEEVNMSDYSLLSIDQNQLILNLEQHVESIKIKPLYNLVKRILLCDLFDDFCKAPAATYNHHSYMGGLLEHSVSVADICKACVPLYKNTNHDILIAGALIHDIGKIYELEFGESISYSSKGNLLGHIFIGANKFQEECKKETNFPDYLADHITHILLSHHGILERGSPVEPKTLEAILVHKADTADADANSFGMSRTESAGDNWLISRTLNRIICLESPPEFELR